MKQDPDLQKAVERLADSQRSTDPRSLAALKRAHSRGTMPIRVAVFVSLEAWRAMGDTLRRDGPGDDWLRAVCWENGARLFEKTGGDCPAQTFSDGR